MDGQLDQFVNELKRQLGQLDRRIRSLALLRGLGFVILVLICLVTVQISLDFVFSLNNTARIALTSFSLTVLVACLWFGMFRRVLHKRTPIELAAIVEESQSSLNERLTSVLELSVAHDDTSSSVMRERLARETIASLTNFNITDSVPSDRAMRFVMSAGIAIIIFLTPLLFWPDAYQLLISRSIVPWGNFATVSSLYFEVEPGDGTVARGEDLQIIATPHWHTKQPGTIDEVWIAWEDAEGQPFSRRMDLDQAAGHYTTQFSRLLSGFTYSISSGSSRTKQYTIQVAEPPSITDTRVVITPPRYTGQAAEELTVLPSEIRVMEQSQIALQLTFDRPISQATLFYQYYASGAENNERPPVEEQPLNIGQDQLTAQLDLPVGNQSFIFHIEFHSKEGGLKNQTSEHLVKITQDRAPEIELSLYNQPEFYKPGETFSVPVKVLDDYAVNELELEIQKLDEKATVVKVPADKLGTSTVDHEFKIDLKELKADQADIFTYRIKAADNREVPGPNVVWSTPRVFGIDKNAEQQLSAGVVARQQKLRDELKKIQQEFKTHQEQVKQEIADLKDQKKQESLSPEDEQSLQELTKQERKLAQQLETVANEFLELPLYQKLAEQTQNLARNDFVKNHDTLKSASAADNRQQAQQELKPVPAAMQQTEKKIDDLVRQYEKLVELENDLHNLDRLAEETDHLANDMLAFNDKVESVKQQMQKPEEEQQADNKTPEKQNDPHQQLKLTPEMKQELSNEQAELKHRQSRLTKDLDDLLERRPELVDAARNFQLKQLDSLVTQASQLVEPQQQLADAMQQQAPVSAGRPLPRDAKAPEPAAPQGAAPQGNDTATPPVQPAAPANGDAPQNAATTAANNEPSTNSQPAETNMSNEPARAQAQSTTQEKMRALQQEQRNLADAAANFLLETAQKFGAESESTQKAAQMAREAIQAEQQANVGQFHEASQAANRAAQIADEIKEAQQARKEQQQNTERDAFLEEAERMAQLQGEVANKLAEASNSEEARKAAIQNSQQTLAQQTQELTRQFSEASQKLENDPIKLNKESRQADQSRKQTEQAGQSMQQAVDNLQQEDLAQAAKQAQQAAQALQAAAQQAQQSRKQQANDSPVPEKVGNQVTDAAQQLRQAQQQMEQNPEFKSALDQLMAQNEQQQSVPRDAESQPDSSNPADQKQEATESGEQQQAQGDSQSGQNGKSSESQQGQQGKNQSQQSAESGQAGKQSAQQQAAESLKQAAESLSQAATELKSKAQQGSDPGKGQQSQTASRNMAPGKGQGESEGGGARTNVDFSKLEMKLKAMSNRNWGELPGELDTEILQGSQSRTDPEYARLIKHYFEAIAKSKSDSK
ncbi:hypothetical protein F1728_09220 [Gimesia benthica]|uniref:DUF4175 family protein n=1 Tax=Gimesia benthica TaxID=2608982 RepID=A0A6I6A938_9PLAN|nr:DUF4175 family protein [Gimesia benthica]QGQ22847.1 hypothetical protein F1728_09220 [Gimesia benthica]